MNRLLASLTLSATVCLAALTGCQRPSSENPVDAYLSFAKAARKGDAKSAFGALTEGSRKALEERAKAASQAGGKATEAPAAAWFLSMGGRTEPVGKAELVSADGGTATVRVTTPGDTKEVLLRKETGGWKVDITPVLEGRKTP